MDSESDMKAIVNNLNVRLSKLESDLCDLGVTPSRLNCQTHIVSLRDLYDSVKACEGDTNRNWEFREFKDNEIRGVIWSHDNKPTQFSINTRVYPAPKTGGTREMFMLNFYSSDGEVTLSGATETADQMIEELDDPTWPAM